MFVVVWPQYFPETASDYWLFTTCVLIQRIDQRRNIASPVIGSQHAHMIVSANGRTANVHRNVWARALQRSNRFFRGRY
jgi:hypothetical protein